MAYDKFATGTSEILTVLTSKANDLDQGTLSQTYTNFDGSTDGADESACIDFNTLVLSATTFASCNGIVGLESSGAAAAISTYAGQDPDADLPLTDTFEKTFDETSIMTQAFH